MDLPLTNAVHRSFETPEEIVEEKSDLWLSTRIVSCLLVAYGFMSIVISETVGSNSLQELLLAPTCYLMAGFVEVTWKYKPYAARRVGTVLVSLIVPVSIAIWQSMESLAFVSLPIIIGISILGRRGAALATLVTTITILTLAIIGISPFTLYNAAMVLIAGMVICAIQIAAYRPILLVASWAHTYIHQAQVLLDEARDRNAELNEALSTLMHVNRQLDITNERLATARHAAERAQESKADFVAKVSHEFRTPLNMIIGLSEFLVRQINSGSRSLPEDIARDIQVIYRNSTHLSSMINDVLNLSQLEAGHLILRKEWVMLSDEIKAAVDVVLPLLEKKGLHPVISVTDELPDVFCDPVRIRQVILNLVGNATRHTDAGSIFVDARVVSGYVQVSVTDTGTGIAPDQLERIFEPFFHGDRSDTAYDQGSGLGLTVSKQLIEQHDGSLWATSELGKGSTFFFKLPIVPYMMPVPMATGWINEDWIWMQRAVQGESLRNDSWWRIIVCDRTGRAHSLLSSYTTGDVELVETQDLAETRAQIEGMPAHLIVIQEEDPAELWRKVLDARQAIADTPVVGCALPTTIEQRMTPDVLDYLVKPVTRSDLRDAVKNLPESVHKVMIVDDDPEIGALFSRMLLELNPGMEIVAFTEGVAALGWMRNNRCDLVLMDLFLPDRDGWGILREKQGIPHMREVPVIVISAQDSDGPVKNATCMAISSTDGLPGGFIVETAFRLVARPRERGGKREPALREILPG